MIWSREALREVLRREPGAASDRPGSWNRGDDGHAVHGGLVPAAVLIGLVARASGPAVLLTQRTAHLRDHAGQIAFPGGRIEAGDVDPVAAALREAEEEIGLHSDRVEILGRIEPYTTVTGFLVHPVVGWIEPPVDLRPDPFEVAEVFEVPLAFTLDPANRERRTRLREDGTQRGFWAMPYGDRFIWGATAGMLVNLATLLQR